MDLLNYFGFEGFIGAILDVGLFVLLVLVYRRVRAIVQENSEVWVQEFKRFLEMLIATIVIPVFTGWASLFVLEDLVEKYAGIIFILSFYPPLIAALYYLYKLTCSAQKNA